MNEPGIHDIRRALARPRPGAAAHVKMAPVPRPGWEPGQPIPADCRQGSVLILLYPRNGPLHFVLTGRTDTVRFHKGQISLPGGACEKGEPLVEAALRETFEEIGVPGEGIEVLGRLSTLYVPPSRYAINPFVAFRPVPPVFTPDPVEVLEVIEVPLAALLSPALRKVARPDHADPVPRRKPYFDFDGKVVWGATAMILMEFAVMLEGV